MTNVVPFAPAWRDRLQLNGSGVARSNLYNAAIAAEAMLPGLYYDEFRMMTILEGPTPWGDVEKRLWQDSDDVNLALSLQSADIQTGVQIAANAVVAVAAARKRHPLREWLNSLRWDGKQRVDMWLVKHMAAENCTYTASVGAAWLVSAVARVMEPGCKADCMLVLEGAEGIKKSSALKALASCEYFSDELADISGSTGEKDAAMQLQGAWIIEMAELETLRKAEFSKIKAFLSRAVDRFRPSYGRNVVERPRQCVFAGTVNPPWDLPNEEGKRRFWVVPVAACDDEGLAMDREQLWAEAVAMYRSRFPWWMVDEDVTSWAREKTEERTRTDAWGPIIEEWIALRTEMTFTVGDVLEDALKIDKGKWTLSDQQRVGKYLGRSGRKSRIDRDENGKVRRVYDV